MRDLTARLRDIVRQDHGGARPSPLRDLTYVPDTDGLSLDPERAARALGGVPAAPGTGCIVIDRVWEPHEWHGRHAETDASETAACTTHHQQLTGLA